MSLLFHKFATTNIYKLLKLTLMKKLTIIVLAVFAILTACTEKTNVNKDAASTNDSIAASGEWTKITPEEISIEPVKELSAGMILAAGTDSSYNAMAIGWGGLGKLWGRPTMTVYVSQSRYTYEFMESNDCFTVNVLPQSENEKVIYVGSHSGRDGDKIKDSGLHPEFTELGNPRFAEANLVIECRKIYSAELDHNQAPEDIKGMYENNKPHIMYVGEIVNAWKK